MKRLLTVFSCAAIMGCAHWCASFAQDPAEPQKRVDEIDAETEKTENDDSEIYHGPRERREAGLGTPIGEYMTIGGVVEIEASYVKADDEEESDITLETVEIGLDLEINEYVSGSLLFSFDEEEAGTLDEGTITVGDLEKWPLSITAGIIYPAFGNYYEHFVTDSPTSELGEIQESAIMIEYENDFLDTSAAAFNGDVDKIGDDDRIADVVLALSLSPTEEIEIGASYITNIADTDSLEEEFVNGIAQRIAGYGAYMILEFDPITLSGEYVAASEPFADDELDADEDESGDEPAAWNVEIAWDITERLEVAARYAGSDQFLDFPEKTYGVVGSWGVLDNTYLSLEWLINEYPAGEDENSLRAQLAVEF